MIKENLYKLEHCMDRVVGQDQWVYEMVSLKCHHNLSSVYIKSYNDSYQIRQQRDPRHSLDQANFQKQIDKSCFWGPMTTPRHIPHDLKQV